MAAAAAATTTAAAKATAAAATTSAAAANIPIPVPFPNPTIPRIEEPWHSPTHGVSIAPESPTVPKPASGLNDETDKNQGDVSEEEMQRRSFIGLISVQVPCQGNVEGAPEQTSTNSSSQPKNPALGAAPD